MKNQLKQLCWFIILLFLITPNLKAQKSTPLYEDKPFAQNFSIKYYNSVRDARLLKVVSDRNGYIQILSDKGLMRIRAGEFLFPGTIVKDTQDRPTSDKKISGIGTYQDQLVYIDNKAVLSNAWAGNLYLHHQLPEAAIFAGGKDFAFLISDTKELQYLKGTEKLWDSSLINDVVKDVKYDEANNHFWILWKSSVVGTFSPVTKKLTQIFKANNLTCIGIITNRLIVGSTDGYYEIDLKSGKQVGAIHQKMPCTNLTSVSLINGKVWFGSTSGAMELREDGKFNYYASERWIPSDSVVNIAKGPDNSVLILTNKGLGKICTERMTLYDKAMLFEKQVRERHLRVGFNANLDGMVNGDVTTGHVSNSDNDGLWTSMYLAGETFRYAVTKSDDALQNVRESLDAMERLYTINPLKSGFPSRSFERAGYNKTDSPWRPTNDPEWDWKSTTSSDEAIGHIFAFGAIAELVAVPEIKNKAIMLIDTLMSHILKNRYYMIDWNGEPTRWGRWNPEYVNVRPENVGDRKICASNITSMLQTAYHFTKKEKFRQAAITLLKENGYLTNLMRPMKKIGMAPADADELSKELSDGWNHSDDEMYFCGYWGLYRYALNDTLKAKYKSAIIDHFEIERPEKEGLWNIMTAIADTKNIDVNEAMWFLQRYPLDLINWTIKNSNRKDIEKIAPNFRNQTITEVLPPDELPISRHNGNRFTLDELGGGRSENSAGDIWLLPYWIGRYLNVIGEPVKK